MVLVVALVGGSIVSPVATLTVLAAFSAAGFLITSAVRLTYLYAGYRRIADSEPSEARGLPPYLPVYSVLVAIYHEVEVAPALLESLAGLDYPSQKLEVFLLIEHDDPETYEACERNLRPGWQIVTVPPGEPRTKPRALNIGLELATGELLTIYDAEDRPEPDQLLKAVAAFEGHSPTVAALQARLDFYNSHQNPLTKWFSCEYATHFGLYLEGIASYGHALPLGGTSTHFRTDVVREIGGWDAWNVTEDCELGMRLARAGFRTDTLDSVTWEEAVPDLRGWIRQRSRWVKGFAQTGFVLLREPVSTARSVGWRGYAASLAIVPGVALTLCGQLIFWTLFWIYVVLRAVGADVGPIEAVFPEPVLSFSVASLLIGNFAMLLAFVAGVYERRRFDLVIWALIAPVYWMLLSFGAWKGVLQLIVRPHVWEKTTHGLAKPEHVPQVAVRPRAGYRRIRALRAPSVDGGRGPEKAADEEPSDEVRVSSEADL